jgi:MGT family glycosyltransferase
MARLLAYTTPGPGNIYPAVPLLLELRRRGHQVRVLTRPSEVQRLRAAGLDATALDGRIQEIEIDDWRARTQVGAGMRLLRAFAARGSLEIDDLRDAIAEVQPDALIVDINAQGAGYLAETTGLPWAQYCPFPPVLRSVDAPPYGLGLRPARGRAGRARDRVMTRMADLTVAPQLRPLNKLRAGLGLEPIGKFDDQFLKADRLIVFTAEPYEYPRRDWPAHVRLVGPSEWGPPGAAPSWLASETRPIVLVTASTERQGDDKLIAAALEGLRDENVAVVATTGAQDPAAFTVPANAHVERFLAHAPIIARAACVISHGGQGTTQKALAAGVPVCAVPFCRDQFEVARRVEVAEAGVRLHHARLTPRRLRAAVHEAMAKRAGAERVAAAFAAAGGPAAAADAVEELLPSRMRASI